MAEKDPEGLDVSNVEASGLQEDIAHWAGVLDRWVKGIDTRLGRIASVTELSGLDGGERLLDGGPAEPFAGEIDADRGEQ
jgi:hypothetical protein